MVTAKGQIRTLKMAQPSWLRPFFLATIAVIEGMMTHEMIIPATIKLSSMTPH